jgi:AraC family transcriptional regulator
MRVGCFSPFHFHRIFQGVTGETLNTHVRRITGIALETGFAGTSAFSRAFKKDGELVGPAAPVPH